MNSFFLFKNMLHNSLWCYFVLLLFSLAVFSSCSKKSDVGSQGDKHRLTINVAGVKTDETNLKKGAFINAADYSNELAVVVDSKTINTTSEVGKLDIDLISSYTNIKSFKNIGPNEVNNVFSPLKKVAALEAMSEGINY